MTHHGLQGVSGLPGSSIAERGRLSSSEVGVAVGVVCEAFHETGVGEATRANLRDRAVIEHRHDDAATKRNGNPSSEMEGKITTRQEAGVREPSEGKRRGCSSQKGSGIISVATRERIVSEAKDQPGVYRTTEKGGQRSRLTKQSEGKRRSCSSLKGSEMISVATRGRIMSDAKGQPGVCRTTEKGGQRSSLMKQIEGAMAAMVVVVILTMGQHAGPNIVMSREGHQVPTWVGVRGMLIMSKEVIGKVHPWVKKASRDHGSSQERSEVIARHVEAEVEEDSCDKAEGWQQANAACRQCAKARSIGIRKREGDRQGLWQLARMQWPLVDQTGE